MPYYSPRVFAFTQLFAFSTYFAMLRASNDTALCTLSEDSVLFRTAMHGKWGTPLNLGSPVGDRTGMISMRNCLND
jgi:hypothetical protein